MAKAGRRPEKKRSLLGQIRLFLDSDSGYEILQVTKLFAAAYGPHLLQLFMCALAVCHYYECYTALTLYPHYKLGSFLLGATVLLAVYHLRRRSSCYLVDFACFKPSDEQRLTLPVCVSVTRASQRFLPLNMLFQLKVLLKSGLGDDTYGSLSIVRSNGRQSLTCALEETETMLFGAMDQLLAKSHVHPRDIDYLIVNVSAFYPSPSIASRVIHHYKLREDVKSYNFSGMGCSTSVMAVDLAKDIFKVHKNKYVLILWTENITLNWYFGNDKSMLMPNCLFRCGSCALLLSNKPGDRTRAKMELLQSIRTITASSDASYNSVFQREDENGIGGFSLSVKLLEVASKALRINITKLLPLAMPFYELLKAAVNVAQRTVLGSEGKPYMPDFRKAFTHFCIHPGGRAIIDGVGKNLRLSDYDLEASRMTLHRFGNTSSSGLWYEVAYLEAKDRLRQGDTLWQLGLGSGFKCNSAVWRVLRNIEVPTSGLNPWLDCIDQYPKEIITTISLSHPHYGLYCTVSANTYS